MNLNKRLKLVYHERFNELEKECTTPATIRSIKNVLKKYEYFVDVPYGDVLSICYTLGTSADNFSTLFTEL